MLLLINCRPLQIFVYMRGNLMKYNKIEHGRERRDDGMLLQF